MRRREGGRGYRRKATVSGGGKNESLGYRSCRVRGTILFMAESQHLHTCHTDPARIRTTPDKPSGLKLRLERPIRSTGCRLAPTTCHTILPYVGHRIHGMAEYLSVIHG